jgi:putative ABC transport system permease protein
MRLLNLFKIAFVAMLKNKMRSLLTMLGIIIGVGAVIVMVAIGQGAQKQIADQIGSLGTNLLTVFPNAFRQGSVSMGSGSASRLTLDDVEKLKKEATLAAGISPMVRSSVQVVGGNGNWSTQISGVSSDFLDIRSWTLASGDFFAPSDVESQSRVCVIGQTILENLFSGLDPSAVIGEQIRLRNVPCRIIGVLSERGTGGNGFDQDDTILAPYTTDLSRLSHNRFIPQILVSAVSSDKMEAASEEVTRIMRESHKLRDDSENDFFIMNQSDVIRAATQTTDFLTVLLASIAGISLVVGGIGIMNIMLVSVTERTREIGIRRAIGARERDILRQFLVESVAISISGGVIGIAVGFLASVVLGLATGWMIELSPLTVFVAFCFAAFVGIFFGFYPARKAAKLNPIEALRYE